MTNLETQTELDPKWLDARKQFCHPNWPLIGKILEAEIGLENVEAIDRASLALGRLWVRRLQEEFGPGYQLLESENFMLISKADATTTAEALRFLERCLRHIHSGLPFIPEPSGHGKWPVLCLEPELFYRYLNDYMDEGDEGDGEDNEHHEEANGLAAVGGVFLNRGYGHFAMPDAEMVRYSRVLVHELTHGVLHTCGLPNWLDEAIAVTVENHLVRDSHEPAYVLNRELIRRHRGYWTEAKIQEFWAGTSFWLPDDGHELSYHLAQFLFKALYQSGTIDPQQVSKFIGAVSREDAGLESAREHLDLDLGEILENLLGPGRWAPDPQIIQRVWKVKS